MIKFTKPIKTIKPTKTIKMLTLALLLAGSAEAIVIRDDVNDSLYLAKAADFPPLATFYVDGAHGTLIEPRWVVTAAHASFCVKSDTWVNINGQAREVANVYVHPDYTPSKSHDIALVELKQAVTDVTPAQLYQNPDEEGQQIWFIGIGGTGNGIKGQTIDNAQNNGVLRKAQNTIIAADGPLIKFRFDRPATALPLEGVSGGGDSGGPAYQTNGSGFKLLGISSRPDGTSHAIGEYGVTEVYSRISFFVPWITQVIKGTPTARQKITLPKLKSLPAGVTNENLAAICQAIGVKPVQLVKPVQAK